MSHSLIPCGKLWRARHCGPSEYRVVRCHCFWYPELRSPTNSIPHTGSCQNKTFLEPVEKFTDWERFRRLSSDLILYRIEINSGEEADKAARDFTASAYGLSTSKVTLSDLNNDLPGLYRLLKHKQKLQKWRHETRDLARKTAVSWFAKTIRRMTRRKAPERWDKR
jgi:hypothetical protein